MRMADGAQRGEREMIRRTAQLLCADIPIAELVSELGRFLADFIPIAALVIDRDDPPAPPPDGGVQLPIRFGQRLVGALTAIPPLNATYDADDMAFLETCTLYLGARLHDDRLANDRAHLAQLAATDGLTGIANRRTFDERLAAEWQRCARSGSALSMTLIDVDHFKAYNDAYGHVSGDACLQKIATALAEGASRPGYVFARYGGEEFAAIFPETDAAGALALAHRMAAAIEALSLAHMATSLGRVSVSIGVATSIPHADGDPETLVRDADAQLYR
jgi:diguanylate cyclase (GGDEF)-like protein